VDYITNIDEELQKLESKKNRRILHGNHGHGNEPYNPNIMSKEDIKTLQS